MSIDEQSEASPVLAETVDGFEVKHAEATSGYDSLGKSVLGKRGAKDHANTEPRFSNDAGSSSDFSRRKPS